MKPDAMPQAEITAHLGQVEPASLAKTAIGTLRQGEWTVLSLTPGPGE